MAGQQSLTIRGAVYVPSEAFNAPQMWKNFSLAETRRDFGYAQEIHLNALRIWASYEYWQMEPEHFKASWINCLMRPKPTEFEFLFPCSRMTAWRPRRKTCGRPIREEPSMFVRLHWPLLLPPTRYAGKSQGSI